MESSSIVSFNNDSTYDTTVKPEFNNVSVHELALHAMRDRCLLLQRRINTLESDNMRLKLDMTKSTEKSPYIPLSEDEKFNLLQKIADLSRQKSQLLHHVFMVSCENKNLWSKLSSIKGGDKNGKELKPLVRTNTYIHSTPKSNSKFQEKYSDSSLEEISLKLINSYILEKSQLIEQYEQMAQLQEADGDLLNVDSIGFAYMEDPATDSLKEMRIQTEKLLGLKKELDEQEKNLKIVLSRLENDSYKCPSCEKNKLQVSYEDKETETSDSLMWDQREATQTNPYNTQNSIEDEKEISENNNPQSGSVCDKICPMCGELFLKDAAFADFQTHVESHFVGDTDLDSIDNFDKLPNSLDNNLS
ncbi:protein spindle-F [Aricia agestis]|uniref:protein spindle-F n=1 Tax=Aricia agestis TaxID=91739 RepID=UPI001C207FEF|nr:protein spindle-F [Aricia agestis]